MKLEATTATMWRSSLFLSLASFTSFAQNSNQHYSPLADNSTMKLLPTKRREWFWVAVQLIVVTILFISVSIYCTSMPGHSYHGPFDKLSEDESALRDRLKDHVSTLATKIGQRNVKHYEALSAAADFIQSKFRELGYEVSNQDYQVDAKPVKNIIAEQPADSASVQLVIVGAHYDSLLGSPGANDNASGVAALLEIAGLLKNQHFVRKVRFVAFVNEEPPYFQTADMGSRRYASSLHQQNENVAAMFSLETIGCYSDAPNTQRYPFPFSLFYPDRGNFIGFVGNTSSRSMVRRSVKEFRENAQFPSEGVAAPGSLTGIGWSDQWSFWEEGYPGVMITDTALFRYKYYHTLSDTPEKLDYDRMARVASGLARVIVDAAGGTTSP